MQQPRDVAKFIKREDRIATEQLPGECGGHSLSRSKKLQGPAQFDRYSVHLWRTRPAPAVRNCRHVDLNLGVQLRRQPSQQFIDVINRKSKRSRPRQGYGDAPLGFVEVGCDRKSCTEAEFWWTTTLRDNECEELLDLGIELDAVLDYMDLLSEVDTSGVSPTHHPLPAVNAMRDDVARQSLDLEDAVRNAPRHKDGCVVVPKVIE